MLGECLRAIGRLQKAHDGIHQIQEQKFEQGISEPYKKGLISGEEYRKLLAKNDAQEFRRQKRIKKLNPLLDAGNSDYMGFT